MKRTYAYLLAAAGVVAAISGVAIAQQAATPAAAPKAAAATPAAATTATAAPAAAPAGAFNIASVQGMPVGKERGQLIAAGVCVSCHNADGNSAIADNPKLAGQHAAYIEKQLMDFKGHDGKKPLRENAIMGGQVGMLSADAKEYEKDIKSLALWFSSQTLVPAASVGQNTELGKSIYRAGIASKGVPACAGCHSITGAGIPSKYPRVSGQFSKYLETQLKLFREDGRLNSPANQMQDIAKGMTDAEIKAVSDYMSGVR